MRCWSGSVGVLVCGALFAAEASGTTDALMRTTLESRWYAATGQYPGQQDRFAPSVVLEPTLDWESDDRNSQGRLVAYLRLASTERDRTHADVRELYWRRSWASSYLLVGIDRVFWGVAESVHLVDVVNQADMLEDVDGEDKLGQPMAVLTIEGEASALSLYALVGFRPMDFPDTSGRLRLAAGREVSRGEVETDRLTGRIDLAARYTGYMGPWDWAVSVFDGTSREPRLEASADGDELVPVYPQLRQFGLELQYTEGPLLGKLEVADRRMTGDRRTAFVGGFEYTLFSFGGTATDLGVLLEYVRDPRPREWPRVAFERGVFFGLRAQANDAADTTALAGLIRNPESGERMWSLEAATRITPNVTLELEGRAFSRVDSGSALEGLRADDFVQLSVNWFF